MDVISKVILCPNLFTEKQIAEADECITQIEKQGYICSVAAESGVNVQNSNVLRHVGLFDAPECDVIVTLGGDGALLRAVQTAAEQSKPLFGINSGRKGYLCAMPFSDMASFREILQKSKTEERMLLSVSVSGRQYLALNDLMLMRDSCETSLDLSICYDSSEALRIRGDGVVISTPSGSTGYNYSAGGPIMHPLSAVIAITPLYANYGLTRTLIVEKNAVIRMTERDNRGNLCVDGRQVGRNECGVQVQCADRYLQLYRNPDYSVKADPFSEVIPCFSWN